MFGMSNTPFYREAGAAADVGGSDLAGIPVQGGALAGSGYRGHGQLMCPTVLWSWLFPASPIYRSAAQTSAANDPVVVTEELHLDTSEHSPETEEGPRLVESKGPVTVVIRRSE